MRRYVLPPHRCRRPARCLAPGAQRGQASAPLHIPEGEGSLQCGVDAAHTKEQEDRYRVALLAPFLRMLVFDAWIGNGDRHSANWAILVRGPLHGSACRLAPMYDTAGCLLADLTDETVERRFGSNLEDTALQRYVEKCRSGFGDGVAEPGILHRDLLERLRKWPEWKEIAAPLIEFFSENLPVVRDLLSEIPPDWLNERRKHLTRRLLEARVMMLRGFAS